MTKRERDKVTRTARAYANEWLKKHAVQLNEKVVKR